MLRRVLLATPFLLVGCAAPRTSSVIVGDETAVSSRVAKVATIPSPEAPPARPPAAPAAQPEVFTLLAPAPEVRSAATLAIPPSLTQRMPPFRQRLTVKGGYYGSNEDGLDDGYIVDVAWMKLANPRFATEFEIGYLDADGKENGVERDVWSIPVLANGRFNLPLGQRLELYGGAGLGSFYYEADAKTAGVKVSADGFLFGGDAFFGGDLRLGQSTTLGLEAKYYLTDTVSELNGGLDAYVVMVTLGFDR